MSRVTWSRRALSDINTIRRRFTNKDRAKATGRRLFEIASHLEQHPELGRVGVVPGTRELIVGGTPYVIIYAVSDDQADVAVLGVVDGRSDWR